MFWCDFIAGWVGGSVGIAVGHPFDTLKVSSDIAMHVCACMLSSEHDCFIHFVISIRSGSKHSPTLAFFMQQKTATSSRE